MSSDICVSGYGPAWTISIDPASSDAGAIAYMNIATHQTHVHQSVTDRETEMERELREAYETIEDLQYALDEAEEELSRLRGMK